MRASTSPTTLTGASAFAQTIVVDLIAATAPVSAGAKLLDAGLQFSFGNSAYISVPSFQATANAVSFVAEGAPFPVTQLTLNGATLEPPKLASIAVLTEEMIGGSNVELMVRDALTRSVGLSLDHVLFDTNPVDAVRSAGLRNGVAASPASTSGDPFNAMIADLTSLAAQVAPVHMNDVPLPISESGTVAAPVQSVWQSASVGLNLRFDVDWALRAPAVAWMQVAGW